MWASVCYSFCFVLTVYLHKFFKKVVFKHRNFSKSENVKYRVFAISIITSIFFIHSLISFLQSEEKIGFMETFQLRPNVFGVIYAIFVNSLLFFGPIMQSFQYNDWNSWSFSRFFEIMGDWEYLKVVLFVKNVFSSFKFHFIFKAPIFEDVVFRDFMYGDLRRSGYNEYQYIWISSILFSFGFYFL